MSPAFQEIVGRLLQTAERPDAGQEKLRHAAYEALMTVLTNVPEDCYPVLVEASQVILDRLSQKVQEAHSAASRGRDVIMQLAEIQSVLCGVVQVCLRNLHRDAVKVNAEKIAVLINQMLQTATGSEQPVQEDALMAISALAEGCFFCS